MLRLRSPTSLPTGTKIPDDMYIGFVDNHLVDIRALVFASLVVIAAQSAVALVNDSAWLWGCIGLTAAVSTTRLYFERDGQGRVTALVLRDDRHQERWEKRAGASGR